MPFYGRFAYRIGIRNEQVDSRGMKNRDPRHPYEYLGPLARILTLFRLASVPKRIELGDEQDNLSHYRPPPSQSSWIALLALSVNKPGCPELKTLDGSLKSAYTKVLRRILFWYT